MAGQARHDGPQEMAGQARHDGKRHPELDSGSPQDLSASFPTSKSISSNTMEKYYLYIDECGDQNLEKYSEKFAIFTLCGIIVSQRQKENLRQKVLSLKRQVFGREDIIFHSFDM